MDLLNKLYFALPFLSLFYRRAIQDFSDHKRHKNGPDTLKRSLYNCPYKGSSPLRPKIVQYRIELKIETDTHLSTIKKSSSSTAAVKIK